MHIHTKRHMYVYADLLVYTVSPGYRQAIILRSSVLISYHVVFDYPAIGIFAQKVIAQRVIA